MDVEVSAGFGRSACRNHRGDNDLLSRRVAFEVEPRNRRVGRIEFNVRYAQRIGAEVVEPIRANELIADRDLRELFRYADGSKQRVAATEFQVNREPATQHAGGVDTREARSYVISPERELGGLRSDAVVVVHTEREPRCAVARCVPFLLVVPDGIENASDAEFPECH